MSWTTLVSALELASALGQPNLAIVDCRFVLAGADPDAGEIAWRASHLPGAGYAHLDRDLTDHRKPATAGRHPVPDDADFCAVLERLGITPQSQVVAYDASDGAMAAARFWWLMKRVGHEAVAVLDGGFARWTALGLPVESATPEIVPGHFQARYRDREAASVDEISRIVTDGAFLLVDARAAERYRGDVEPLDSKAGHIPGAINRHYALNLRDGGFKPAIELREEFNALLGDRSPQEVVLYCGSGVTACHNLLAMEHAGLRGARIFPPSWSGWIADATHPIGK